MKHAEAIARAIKESGLDQHDDAAPLLELCRTLAGQMDTAGAEPSTRLTAAYLSALKDLRRAVADHPPPRTVNRLDRLREARARPAPSKKVRPA